MTRYARWVFAQQGAQPVDNPNFDVLYKGRRTQVHGRHEHQRTPLYATVRWDPDEQRFDDYALVAVAPEYRAAEALKLQLHIRPYRGRWRVDIASLRRSSELPLVETARADPTATLFDGDRERTT